MSRSDPGSLHQFLSWRWVIREPTCLGVPVFGDEPARTFRSAHEACRTRCPISRPDRFPAPSSELILSCYTLWMIAGQIAPWIGTALLDDDRGIPFSGSPGGSRGAVNMLFRVLACACCHPIWSFARTTDPRPDVDRLFVLAVCTLPVSSSISIAFIVGFPPVDDSDRRRGGELWSAGLGAQESSRLPRPLQARWASRPSTFSTDRESSDVMEARFAFHRLKILPPVPGRGRPGVGIDPLRPAALFLQLVPCSPDRSLSVPGRFGADRRRESSGATPPRLVSQAGAVPAPVWPLGRVHLADPDRRGCSLALSLPSVRLPWQATS